jgi:transposase-like protein
MTSVRTQEGDHARADEPTLAVRGGRPAVGSAADGHSSDPMRPRHLELSSSVEVLDVITEAAERELFPQRVIEEAKQVAEQPDASTTRSSDLAPLVTHFHSEEKCLAYLEQLRWPDGVRCPRCDADRGISRIRKRRQYECDSCGYQFSARVGTIFEASHLPLWKWFLAMYVMGRATRRTSSNQLKRLLGVSYKTAWSLNQRIRPAMKNEALEPVRGLS